MGLGGTLQTPIFLFLYPFLFFSAILVFLPLYGPSPGEG